MDTGDVIAVVQELDHPLFERKGVDLFVKKSITLVDALCGFTFVLDHLDDRKIAIHSAPGEVLFPGKYLSICLFSCLFVHSSIYYDYRFYSRVG